MTRRRPELDPELEAFLRPCRIKRDVPPEIRDRALANARAIVAGGRPTASARPQAQRWASHSMAPARARRRVWIAVAASVAIAGAAVGAVAALRAVDPPVSPRLGVVAAPEAKLRQPADETATVVAERTPAAKPSRVAPAAAARDPLVLEIELLQRAHAAYTRGDVAVSLKLATEHARRFPNGRLAEEREALRIRSLDRLGRTDEAHRAAAAFAVRFPRSILLPRVEDGVSGPR